MCVVVLAAMTSVAFSLAISHSLFLFFPSLFQFYFFIHFRFSLLKYSYKIGQFSQILCGVWFQFIYFFSIGAALRAFCVVCFNGRLAFAKLVATNFHLFFSYYALFLLLRLQSHSIVIYFSIISSPRLRCVLESYSYALLTHTTRTIHNRTHSNNHVYRIQYTPIHAHLSRACIRIIHRSFATFSPFLIWKINHFH